MIDGFRRHATAHLGLVRVGDIRALHHGGGALGVGDQRGDQPGGAALHGGDRHAALDETARQIGVLLADGGCGDGGLWIGQGRWSFLFGE